MSNLPAGVSLAMIDELHAAGSPRDLAREIEAATQAALECPRIDAGGRAAYQLGVLTGMLKGLIGASEFCGHNTCLDEQATAAVEQLLAALALEV